MKKVIGKHVYLVEGGHEFNGDEIVPFNETELQKIASELSGKVDSVKVEVIKTNLDKEDVFQLMPIIISNGKTTTTTFVPYYSEVYNLVIKYKYKDKVYKMKTELFEFVEITKGKTYARLEEKNIGKQDVPIVVYRN